MAAIATTPPRPMAAVLVPIIARPEPAVLFAGSAPSSSWRRTTCGSASPSGTLSDSRSVASTKNSVTAATQRTSHLADHAGQIAFPGGKIDAVDASLAAAALREAEEEIALDRRFVEPIGYLDVHITPSGFRILPTLARVREASRFASTAMRLTTPSKCHSPS
jgi:8-oxo-dGTP pyrophosphatase MutT (NUDIX family)